MVDAGDRAPSFTAPSGGGGKIAMKDFKGKKVVLYFYPKDDTPGCTTEAKDFTEFKAQVFRQRHCRRGGFERQRRQARQVQRKT